MRMEGYRGRGFSLRGGYRGDRLQREARYEASDHGPPRSSHGRGFYESSRGRYDTSRGRRYEGSYVGPQTEEHISRKRSHLASGSGEYHSRGRPSQDDTYYSGRRPSKGWMPSPPSPNWVDEGRHERKRLKSVVDNYSEATSSRRHDSHHYDRSENQERRGYREEQPRHASRGPGRYYTSSYEEYHGERRESRYPFSRSQYSPPRRGYISRGPPPSYSPRGAGTRLRGRGLGLERGYGGLRFLRRGGTAYDLSFKRFARKREWLSLRRSVFGTPSQMQRGLFLRRRALDNRLFLARNRRLKKDADDSELENWDDEDDDDDELKEKKGKTDEGKDGESGEAGSKDKAKGGKVQVTIQQDREGRAVNKNDETGRQRIKLLCPHCKYRAITFMEYNYHLRTSRHIRALNSLSYYIKMALSKMLIKQRMMQKDLEKKKEEDGGELSEKSSYCNICKLLYRDPKSDHQVSEMHKLLKKFLQPYCVVCEMNFTSPMSYEKHTASLFHMKKKARAIKWKTDEEGGDSMQGDEEPPEFDEEINPDNFMTVDSVGDVDEEQQEEDGENAEKKTNEKVKEKDAKTETPKPKTSSTVSPAGEKYVKKLFVFYCSLCRRYLRPMHPLEKAALIHSTRRMHIRNRRQKKKQLAMKEAAAKKQASQQAEGESHDGKEAMEVETGTETKQLEKDGATSTDDIMTEKVDTPETEGKEHTKTSSENEDKEGLENKLWDDVDRDLGELLKEVDSSNTRGNDSGELDKNVDDDDEQGEQERWDRLKTSQKVKVPLESKSDELEEDMKTEEEGGDD